MGSDIKKFVNPKFLKTIDRSRSSRSARSSMRRCATRLPRGSCASAACPGRSRARSPNSSPSTFLARPGFLAGKDARDLYTLDPITEVGPGFAFDHAYDERILEVRIVAAAADFFAEDEDGKWRYVRSLESKDASGAALRHFRGSEVRFGRGWRLGEITFRVFFKTDAKRPAQVTVRLKPPGTLAFRRTRFEKAIHALVARNGLEKDRDADLVLEAAE